MWERLCPVFQKPQYRLERVWYELSQLLSYYHEFSSINCNVKLIAQNSRPKEVANVNMFAGMCRILKPARNESWSRLGSHTAWSLRITCPAHPGYLTSALLFSKMAFTTLCRATARHHGITIASTSSTRNIETPQTPPQLHHNNSDRRRNTMMKP